LHQIDNSRIGKHAIVSPTMSRMTVVAPLPPNLLSSWCSFRSLIAWSMTLLTLHFH